MKQQTQISNVKAHLKGSAAEAVAYKCEIWRAGGRAGGWAATHPFHEKLVRVDLQDVVDHVCLHICADIPWHVGLVCRGAGVGGAAVGGAAVGRTTTHDEDDEDGARRRTTTHDDARRRQRTTTMTTNDDE